jgi:hypothetical protein
VAADALFVLIGVVSLVPSELALRESGTRADAFGRVPGGTGKWLLEGGLALALVAAAMSVWAARARLASAAAPTSYRGPVVTALLALLTGAIAAAAFLDTWYVSAGREVVMIAAAVVVAGAAATLLTAPGREGARGAGVALYLLGTGGAVVLLGPPENYVAEMGNGWQLAVVLFAGVSCLTLVIVARCCDRRALAETLLGVSMGAAVLAVPGYSDEAQAFHFQMPSPMLIVVLALAVALAVVLWAKGRPATVQARDGTDSSG